MPSTKQTSIVELDSSPRLARRLQYNDNRTMLYNNDTSTSNISQTDHHQSYHRYRSSERTSPTFDSSNDTTYSQSAYSASPTSFSVMALSTSLVKNPQFSTFPRNHRLRASFDQLNHSLVNSKNLNSSNTNNNSFHLSDCLSQSECGSMQNVNANNYRTSNKTCDKYGFFVESKTEDENVETISTRDLKEIRFNEKKWLQMLNNWKYYINFKWEKIRDRCRKGIPHSIRSQAWYYLCGAHLQKKRSPFLYTQLLNRKIPDDIKNDICKDLNRQFPNHELFADPNGNGQADLYNILKAFAVYKPSLGYCQAQAPIAAVLLMLMPAEHAFFCLVSLSKYYINGYFMRNLEDIQIHGRMLFAFTKKFCSPAHNLLKRQSIDPALYMVEWFMCIYSRNLPWPSVLRVWDMFLCEGLTILFKVGLYLTDVALKKENHKTCPTMYETVQKLRNIPKKFLDEDNLIKGIKKFDLKDSDLLKEHKHQSKKYQKFKNTE